MKHNMISVYLSPKKPVEMKLLEDIVNDAKKTGVSVSALISTILKNHYNKKVDEQK